MLLPSSRHAAFPMLIKVIIWGYTILLAFAQTPKAKGILYPKESETREVKLLDGVWNFCISQWYDQEQGFREKWFQNSLKLSGCDVIPMAVPSSFNDITQNKTIRDFIGWAWYDKQFFVPQRWLDKKKRVVLRFGSAHYFTQVYVNGVPAMNHTGGHLPFQTDIGSLLNQGPNLVTVALNNTLTPITIPQGTVEHKSDLNLYPPGYFVQNVNFDFFNYAGIHRSVALYSTPSSYIDDIDILTNIINSTIGIINYRLSLNLQHGVTAQCQVQLFDKLGQKIAQISGCSGTLKISSAKLWWPYTTHPEPGYLYTLKFQLTTTEGVTDSYYQTVGIRTIKVDHTSFLINGKPFYFMGFGKHEDANIRGKGLDIPLIVKDFNLIKWIGANSFRTSHYPYSEELMDAADEQGIVVIDECPAVGLDTFNDALLKQHLQTIRELIQRDKNRPSVVMWSVANEPHSTLPTAEKYFKKVVDTARSLDSTRPISAALNADCTKDKAGQFFDVIMENRYYGWYSDTGHPEVVYRHLVHEFPKCQQAYNKTILISEYGADTISGMHQDPTVMFTEDFQVEYLGQHHLAFDKLRATVPFIGELIWNFADFMTEQGLTRIVGNKKGIFTRERQPKAAARLLRQRYLSLANGTKRFKDKPLLCSGLTL